MTSFISTDLDSTNSFFSLFLTFVDFISLIALAFWFVALFHKYNISQSLDTKHYDSAGGFDGSGAGSG